MIGQNKLLGFSPCILNLKIVVLTSKRLQTDISSVIFGIILKLYHEKEY